MPLSTDEMREYQRARRARLRAAPAALDVIAYLRASTEEQGDSRLGLEAQRAEIMAEAKRKGWRVVDVIEDAGYSGKDLRRPGVLTALDALTRHRAGALVVSKLDRLSRSMLDFAGLMDRATRQHWGLIALDLNVDTTTPAGEAMAHVLATFAQFERRLISERTRAALAQAKIHGTKSGRPIGRQRVLPLDVVRRIVEARAAGRTYQGIADDLNADQVPTAQGAPRWTIGIVRKILATSAAVELAG